MYTCMHHTYLIHSYIHTYIPDIQHQTIHSHTIRHTDTVQHTYIYIYIYIYQQDLNGRAGIIPRSLCYIFDGAARMASRGCSIKIKCSLLEIYNEVNNYACLPHDVCLLRDCVEHKLVFVHATVCMYVCSELHVCIYVCSELHIPAPLCTQATVILNANCFKQCHARRIP